MFFGGTQLHAAVPAFPGAMGSGALTPGGRGGRVIEVTNLNDSGAGSLRDALSQSGARTVVFKVSGTIKLSSGIRVMNPYLTVAGQTAPGGGIEIVGFNNSENQIYLYTHDVIFRYLRIRAGYNASRPPASQAGAPIFIGNSNAYNIVIDHCSLIWSADENFTIWNNDPSGVGHDFTLQYSIIGQGFQGHSTGIITGSGNGLANQTVNIDFHHNLIAENDHRDPLLKNKSTRFVNNIVYNWGYYATMGCAGLQGDFINNVYKKGPMSDSIHEFLFSASNAGDAASGTPSIYLSGNIGPHNSTPSADNWAMAANINTCEVASEAGAATQFKRTSPMAAAVVPIVADDTLSIRDNLVNIVGPYRRLNQDGSWTANMDNVDQSIISDYKNSTGGPIPFDASVNSRLTLPAVTSGYVDSDHDGIPDAWETAHGLNPQTSTDGAKDSGNGYTWLERFLNGDSAAVVPPPAQSTTATLTATPTSLSAGAALKVSWTAANTVSSDSVALYAVNAASALWSQSTNGTTTGSISISAPATAGQYEFRYLSGGTSIAKCAAITVTTTSTPPSSTTFKPIRVNAGGGAYTDSKGQAWAADTGYPGGYNYSSSGAISGTTDTTLYQTEHYGMTSYQFAVPNGSYLVNLKFAEFYWTAAGQRVFNVTLNGQAVLSNFDIIAAAGGAKKALDKSFPVTVTNGQISIQFAKVTDNAKIDAIEIVQNTAPVVSFTPIRVNAGGAAYTDSKGQVWSADTAFTGGYPFSTSNSIGNTADQTLYKTEHYGSSTSPVQYAFSVPNGTYTVNLKFAEIYFNATGKRVFNVLLNGKTVLSNFDVVAAAGGSLRAIDKPFTVGVTNGQILVQFGRITDNPKVSAIEIVRQ